MLSSVASWVVNRLHSRKENDADNVRKSLEKELEVHQFISLQRLKEIVKVDSIQLQLEDLDKQASQRIASTALDNALKLFSILILLNKQAYFRDLLEAGVDDNIFAGQCTDNVLFGGLKRSGKVLSSKKSMIDFPNVGLESLRVDLCNYQWRIPPPFVEDKIIEFPPAYVRPIYKSNHLGAGGYGEVWKVTLGGGHIPGYPSSTEDVVEKRIWMSKDERIHFLREPATLHARKHPHIVPLLASFITTAQDGQECLHLLQPYAVGGDMEKWLTSETTPEKPPFLQTQPSSLPDFLYKSVVDLVSALAYVHSTIDRRWTGHWDLKPSNILLFQENGQWIWKLADFGHAHLKARDRLSRPVGGSECQLLGHSHFEPVEDTPGTHRIMGSFEYQPPEYGNKDQKYVSFDVFSMGCIIVELATMIVFKDWSNNQVSVFRELRRQNNDPKKENELVLDGSFRNNLDVVMRWIEDLKEKKDCRKLERLLEIAEDMVAVAPGDRLLAFDAALDFWELVHREERASKFESVCRAIVKGQDPKFGKFGQCYNPVLRSKSRDEILGQERAQFRQNCLLSMGWPGAGHIRQYTEQLVPSKSGKSYSNFPYSFRGDKLYGREREMAAVDWMFKYDNVPHVGIYGLGGMGKSHVAWEYVSKLRAQSFGRVLHTFWIQAQDKVSFEADLFAIARKIGIQNTLGQDCAADVTEWLKDPDNGPWVLVLDGLEQSVEQWGLSFPWNAGKILITTKNRSVASRHCNSSIVKIGELKKKDAGKLLQNLSEEPSPRAEALAEKLCFPMLIKIMGKLIHQDKLGGRSIESMDNEIRGAIQLPDFAAGQEGLNPDTRNLFGLLFKPLETVKLYHDAFRIMCFFSHHDIDTTILEKEFNDGSRTEIYSGLANLSYLTPVSDQKYRIHEAVQAMFLRWLSDRKGKGNIWSGYLRAINTLHNHYRAQKEAQTESSETPIYLLRLRCKVHIQVFLQYVRSNTEIEARYPVNSAVSVVTFATWLREENRFEDSEFLLRHILKQGIEGDDGRKRLFATQLALIETYRASASGRSKPGKLDKALKQANEAIVEANEANDLPSRHRLYAARVNILRDQQDYEAAEKALAQLEKLPPESSEEEQKALLRNLELRALINRSLGEVECRTDLLERAREIWGVLRKQLPQSSYSEQQQKGKLEGICKNDANTCLSILKVLNRLRSKGESLDEKTRQLGSKSKEDADEICTNLVREKRAIYARENHKLGEHKHVSDATANMGAVNLRWGIWTRERGYVEDSRQTFEKVLNSYQSVSKLDMKDKDFRYCAYNLREALSYLDKAAEGESQYARHIVELDEKYGLSPRKQEE